MLTIPEIRSIISASEKDAATLDSATKILIADTFVEVLAQAEDTSVPTQTNHAVFITAHVLRQGLTALLGMPTMQIFFSPAPLEALCEDHRKNIYKDFHKALSILHTLGSLSHFKVVEVNTQTVN